MSFKAPAPESKQQNVAYFPMVDVLRGFAAISVLTLHVIAHTNWESFPTTGPLAWFRVGSAGVDLFFVISGFVVLHSAAGLIEKNDCNFRITFATRRFARILPLYFLTSAVALLLIHQDLIAHPAFVSHLLAHVFLVHTFDPNWFSSINGVNWSIGIEVHFYILILLLLPGILRVRMLTIIVVGILIAWLWRYLWRVYLPIDTTDYLLFVRTVQLPGRLDEFAFGMAIALFVRSAAFHRLRSQEIWGPVLALAAIAALYFYFTYEWVTSNQFLNFTISNTLLSGSFALLVFSFCLIRSERVIRMCAPLRYLGTISYGLYLWHLTVITMLKRFEFQPLSVLIITLAMTCLLSVASWHFFEKPLIALARGLEPKAQRDVSAQIGALQR